MGPAWCTKASLLAVLCTVQVLASHARQHEYMCHDTHNPLERINMLAVTAKQDNAIKLEVSTNKLTKGTGQWVEVSWHGVPHPSYADWVALLVPADADPTRVSPAKYQMASADLDKTHLTQGRGRLRFRLINYRSPMQFLFFRGGLMQPMLAARSPAIVPANPNAPLQRRLALTGLNTQMVVQWTTRDSKHPVVKWGTRSGQYDYTTAATSSTYTINEMCGPPASTIGWTDPGTFHTAVLEGLQPGGTYFYTVGDEEWGFSPEASFRAAPEVGPSTTVQLLALADLGQAEDDGSMEQSEMGPSLNTTGGILKELQGGSGHQLLLHNGDISYARGYVTQWDNYMHQLEPIISHLPYMTVPGNHERDWPDSGDRFHTSIDSGGECGAALERRFQMPTTGRDKPWYSFDFGPIHFLQYSTEHEFAPGSEQHNWVLSDLAAVNRRKTPWLVVGGHRPMYISSTNTLPGDGDQPVAADLRKAFEEVFLHYKVDLTLHGHHHSYQRTCPAFAGKCQGPAPTLVRPASSSRANGSVRDGGHAVYVDAAAPVHLVIGNAGAELSWNVEPRPAKIWQTIKLWWGYLRIQASGTQLRCEAVSDLNGGVTDAVTLIKSEGWAERHMAKLQQQQQQEALPVEQGRFWHSKYQQQQQQQQQQQRKLWWPSWREGFQRPTLLRQWEQ